MFPFADLPESIINIILSYLDKHPIPSLVLPIKNILSGLDENVCYIEGKKLEINNIIKPMIINPYKIDLFMINYEPSILTNNSKRGLFCLWIKNILESKLSIKDMNLIRYLFTDETIEVNEYNELISSVRWRYSIC